MTLSAFADERPGIDRAGRAGGGHGLMKLRKCLSGLDLSADQKSSIQSMLDKFLSDNDSELAPVETKADPMLADPGPVAPYAPVPKQAGNKPLTH